MNLFLSALAVVGVIPLVGARLYGRPLTDLDRRLSAVDVELDARQA